MAEMEVVEGKLCQSSEDDMSILIISSLCSSADEDEIPEVKIEREKERRQANNARERYI